MRKMKTRRDKRRRAAACIDRPPDHGPGAVASRGGIPVMKARGMRLTRERRKWRAE